MIARALIAATLTFAAATAAATPIPIVTGPRRVNLDLRNSNFALFGLTGRSFQRDRSLTFRAVELPTLGQLFRLNGDEFGTLIGPGEEMTQQSIYLVNVPGITRARTSATVTATDSAGQVSNPFRIDFLLRGLTPPVGPRDQTFRLNPIADSPLDDITYRAAFSPSFTADNIGFRVILSTPPTLGQLLNADGRVLAEPGDIVTSSMGLNQIFFQTSRERTAATDSFSFFAQDFNGLLSRTVTFTLNMRAGSGITGAGSATDVPAPAAAALVLFGLAGLAARRRR